MPRAATLEAAAAACGELGAACGGVVRDQSRGGYELRAAGAPAERAGATLWPLHCESAVNDTVGGPCARYSALVGAAKWASTRQALLRLLAEQHKCVLPADAISLAAAAAPTTVATAAAEGGARSAGAPTSAELARMRAAVTQAESWSLQPPEPRRMVEERGGPTDGSFDTRQPLEMWEEADEWKRRRGSSKGDAGELLEVPWRDTINCTCARRPPGKCSCVQYAECQPISDPYTNLVYKGKTQMAFVNAYAKAVETQLFERGTSWDLGATNEPVPLVYTDWNSEAATKKGIATPVPWSSLLQLNQSEANHSAAADVAAAALGGYLAAQLDERHADAAMLELAAASPSEASRASVTSQGYGSYSDFVPFSREQMHCVAGQLQCNCSHTCKCKPYVPDPHPTCPNVIPKTPWGWPPLRIRCGDEGLQTMCSHYGKCSAYGEVTYNKTARASLGQPSTVKCIQACYCQPVLCWGLLWF